ncbi:hypothetical protein A0J61_09994 [Choanephora cucurbitarum]|uniref:Uncharacterized protein n=1 Tax=Choanephora cucurbitarum TaxID=101091 RepID=A0A1C7MYW1_9FUNG|nr:hypothetical protein A0J61_09994 [Choanephora cucurbitarum]
MNLVLLFASSGKNYKDLEHSRDDTLKNVHGSICALEAILRRYPNASFATASSLLSFTVQSISTTIKLSTTALDAENIDSFLHQECRSVHYDERIEWMKVFELVSKLVMMLREQALIIDQLQKEQSGIIPIDNVETVRFVLS